jgi:hypothetical protein
MNIRMSTSLAWVGTALPEDTRLVFDVQGLPDDWIILGKKKGYYTADVRHSILAKYELIGTQPDVKQDQQIVLVPMRSGSLFLPTVTVQLLSSSVSASDPAGELVCETYVENAAETIDVLPAKAVVTALIPVHDVVWEQEEAR